MPEVYFEANFLLKSLSIQIRIYFYFPNNLSINVFKEIKGLDFGGSGLGVRCGVVLRLLDLLRLLIVFDPVSDSDNYFNHCSSKSG